MTNLQAAARLAAGFLVTVVVAGCSMKDPAPSDTAQTADSIAPANSAAPIAPGAGAAGVTLDSAATNTHPPADASGNLTGETRKSGGTMGEGSPPRPERDSAFGPVGTMDSGGAVRPIKR